MKRLLVLCLLGAALALSLVAPAAAAVKSDVTIRVLAEAHAQGANDRGQVAGRIETAEGWFGYRAQAGSVELISQDFHPRRVGPDGAVVGNLYGARGDDYWDAAVAVWDGKMRVLPHPAGVWCTGEDVNASGTVAGSCDTGHVAVWRGSGAPTLTPISVLQAAAPPPAGDRVVAFIDDVRINNRGELLVSLYQEGLDEAGHLAGRRHDLFIYDRGKVTLLTPDGRWSTGWAIANNGLVAGWTGQLGFGSDPHEPTVWRKDRPQPLSARGSGEATAVNERGDVAGTLDGRVVLWRRNGAVVPLYDGYGEVLNLSSDGRATVVVADDFGTARTLELQAR